MGDNHNFLRKFSEVEEKFVVIVQSKVSGANWGDGNLDLSEVGQDQILGYHVTDLNRGSYFWFCLVVGNLELLFLHLALLVFLLSNHHSFYLLFFGELLYPSFAFENRHD